MAMGEESAVTGAPSSESSTGSSAAGGMFSTMAMGEESAATNAPAAAPAAGGMFSTMAMGEETDNKATDGSSNGGFRI